MRASHIHIGEDGVATRVPIVPVAKRPRPTELPRFASNLPRLELKRTSRETTSEMQPASRFDTAGESREASSLNTKYTPTDYHKNFCAHDRPRWMVCSAATCRRDKNEAAQNWITLVVKGQNR